MDGQLGNEEGLQLAASRLRRDADLVASMGNRVGGASDRVAFTGPAADRLRSDALTWRSTSNGIARALLSVADMLDRAAMEMAAGGSTGSAVGLAAWGSGSPIATVGSTGFTSSAFGGGVGSADTGYVTIGGYNPLGTGDTGNAGYVTTIGGYNPLGTESSGTGGGYATVGGYNPLGTIGSVGTGSGSATVGGYNPLVTVGTGSAGNVATIGGYNPLGTDGTSSGGTMTTLTPFNPFADQGRVQPGGNVATVGGIPLEGRWFVDTIGYIPVDVQTPLMPNILWGGLYNSNTLTGMLANSLIGYFAPGTVF